LSKRHSKKFKDWKNSKLKSGESSKAKDLSDISSFMGDLNLSEYRNNDHIETDKKLAPLQDVMLDQLTNNKRLSDMMSPLHEANQAND